MRGLAIVRPRRRFRRERAAADAGAVAEDRRRSSPAAPTVSGPPRRFRRQRRRRSRSAPQPPGARIPGSHRPPFSRSPAKAADLRSGDRLRRQAARAGRPRQPLSVEHADHGRQFRAGRAGRRPHRGQVLHPEARQGALRIRSAEPDRHHRRRLLGRGARPQAATQDLYPLSQTPLRYLLADRIDLLRDTDVVSVVADDTSSPSPSRKASWWSAPAG